MMPPTYADPTGLLPFAKRGRASLQRARRLQCRLFQPRRCRCDVTGPLPVGELTSGARHMSRKANKDNGTASLLASIAPSAACPLVAAQSTVRSTRAVAGPSCPSVMLGDMVGELARLGADRSPSSAHLIQAWFCGTYWV